MKKHVTWLSENRIEIIILLIAGLVVNASCYLQLFGTDISFLDTDDYMRLVRIREFFINYDLPNNIIHRSNVPFGCSLHWTRFYDFFLIVPSYFLSFFTDSLENAIEYVGFFISPIIKSITIVLIYNVFFRLMKKDDAFYISLFFATNFLLLSFGSFGRPDHHAFIMLFIVIFLKNVLSFAESGFKRDIDCTKLALITSLCVWISPETLIPLIISDVVLFIFFLNDQRLDMLCKKNIRATFFIGIIVLLSVISGFFYALLIVGIIMFTMACSTKISSGCQTLALIFAASFIPLVTPIEYDKISIIHVGLYLFSSIFFSAAFAYFKIPIERKLAPMAVWLIILAAVFLYLFPRFFCGMSANIDDYLRRIWLNRIAEMRSPIEHGDGLFFISYSMITLMAVINKIFELVKDKGYKAIFWWIIIINTLCYTFFASFSYRMVPYSVLFSIPLMEELGMNSRFVLHFNRIVRLSITFFMVIFLVMLAAVFKPDADKKKEERKYSKRELYTELNKLSEKPAVIMAHSNYGPEILYYTKHSVVGSPYHRQKEGIVSCYEVIENEYNETSVRKILQSTGASYILVEKPSNTSCGILETKRNLSSLLLEGYCPNWLSIEKLSEKFSGVVIGKVRKHLL